MSEPTDPSAPANAVYGAPPPELAEVPPDAAQVSPLRPGALALEALGPKSLSSIVVAAPPGAVERRFVLAHALRALRPGGALTALAPKDKGGGRLNAELSAFGCAVEERFKARQRICTVVRPAVVTGIEAAITDGAPRMVAATGLWSQPGIFSFDRIDPGSALLLKHLPRLKGQGADLGAGLGVLSQAVLGLPAITSIALVETDRRAVEASRLNVTDPRATFYWADARTIALSGLDFVVTNPPFHEEGSEDRGLGQAFIRSGARALSRGGRMLLVANRHLPYEATLREAFRSVETIAEAGGYKIFEAVK